MYLFLWNITYVLKKKNMYKVLFVFKTKIKKQLFIVCLENSTYLKLYKNH